MFPTIFFVGISLSTFPGGVSYCDTSARSTAGTTGRGATSAEVIPTGSLST